MALSHTPSLPAPPDHEQEPRSRQAPPLAAFILAAFSAVIVFLPPEGRIGAPLHQGVALLLGRAAFILPLALVLAGVLLVVRALRPSTPLPRRRLAGIALMTLAILPAEHLLGRDQSTGMVGGWLSGWLLDLVGGPATLVLLVSALGLGVLLAFNVRLLLRAHKSDSGAPTEGKWKDAAS